MALDFLTPKDINSILQRKGMKENDKNAVKVYEKSFSKKELKMLKYIARKAVRMVYELNCVGGPLHIVVEDTNIKDYHIIGCIKNIIDSPEYSNLEKRVYLFCAGVLMMLSNKGRESVCWNYNKDTMPQTYSVMPCPHCGGSVSVYLTGDDYYQHYYIATSHFCKKPCRCRCFMESHEFEPSDTKAKQQARKDLIEKWNKRAYR